MPTVAQSLTPITVAALKHLAASLRSKRRRRRRRKPKSAGR